MFVKEVVSVNDTLWIVQRKIRIDHNPIVSIGENIYVPIRCLKREPYYYFCKEVTDVEWEDI